MLRNANKKERMKSHNTNGFIIHIYELSLGFRRHLGPTWTYWSLLFLSTITALPCTKINPFKVKKDWTKSVQQVGHLGGSPKYVTCTRKEKHNAELANTEITRCELCVSVGRYYQHEHFGETRPHLKYSHFQTRRSLSSETALLGELNNIIQEINN